MEGYSRGIGGRGGGVRTLGLLRMGHTTPPLHPPGHTLNQSIDPRGNNNPTHPEYQNDNINNTQIKMLENDLT